MYGLGLPLLFPIASLSLFILYGIEKAMIYYSYQQPPMYDEKLNNHVLSLLTWAPCFMLGFSYWMFSHPQLLANEVELLSYSNSAPDAAHYWYSVFELRGYGIWNDNGEYMLSPAFPLLVTFWIVFLGTLLRKQIMWVLTKLFGEKITIGAKELDEDLENYFKTLDDHDRNWSIKEDENVRNVLNMRILNDYTLQKLKTTQQGTKDQIMQGTHTYDILANPLYLDDFQYFSADIEDRELLIKDEDDDEENDNAQSDLVRIVLNLAYLTEEHAKSFSFDVETYKNVKQGSKGTSINRV